MHAIYRMADPNMPDNHIVINHIETTNPTFFIYKVDGKVAAFQAHSFYRVQTPFRKRVLPVLYTNLSYKHPEAGKEINGFSANAQEAFLASKMGRFWFLKPFVITFQTYNPKVLGHLNQRLRFQFPHPYIPTPKKVAEFGQQFFRETLNIHYATIDEELIKDYHYPAPTRITEKWPKFFRSKDNRFNDMILRHKVIQKEGDEYYLTGKAVFMIGFYNLWVLLRPKRSVR